MVESIRQIAEKNEAENSGRNAGNSFKIDRQRTFEYMTGERTDNEENVNLTVENIDYDHQIIALADKDTQKLYESIMNFDYADIGQKQLVLRKSGQEG